MADERGLSASWCVVAALTLPLGALAQKSPPRQRVPGQHLHHQRSGRPVGRRGRRRRLRRRLGRATARTATQYGVFGRRFSSAGVSLARRVPGQRVHLRAHQRFPSVAIDADGDFVVTWQSLGRTARTTASSPGVSRARALLLASEFQVNTYTTGDQIDPRWRLSRRRLRRGLGRASRRTARATGSSPSASRAPALSSASRVPGQHLHREHQRLRRRWRPTPTAISSSPGRATTRTARTVGVFARRFSSAGAALASEFQVNTYTTDESEQPRRWRRTPTATSSSPGEQLGQDGSAIGIFARRYTSAGVALASEFQVNTYTTGHAG